MRKGLLSAAVLAVLVAGYSSCKKDNDNNTTTTGKAKVSMHLTDAPADYDNVYVDIQKVEVTMKGSSAVTLTPIQPGIYDLLKFSNGIDTLLLTTDLPAGTIEQIRLVLGNNNTIVVNSQSYPLTTPSG